MVILPEPGGLTVEIRPLVATRRWRLVLGAIGAAAVGAAGLGLPRLFAVWEEGLKRGFGDLPLPLLAVVTLALGISTPLALFGLAALAFAEEKVEVGPEEITIQTTAFERTRIQRIRRAELECWRETYLPLPPWWTWAVKRLAAKSGGRLFPLAGAAGSKEKRQIGKALARATGKPLIDDFGRAVKS